MRLQGRGVTAAGRWMLLLATALAAAAPGCTAGTVAKVEQMLTELRRGNYDQAYWCCTTEEFRSKVSSKRFKAVLSEYPIEKASGFKVTFRKKFSTNSCIADAVVDTKSGPLPLTFYIYLPIFGFDYLVGQILVRDERLFVAELGDW
jgi:hypothetical protein